MRKPRSSWWRICPIPIGWWRDTAQQLLVQRNDKSAVPALQQLATTAPDFRTRVQAVWTLAGMGSLDADTVKKALEDSDRLCPQCGLARGRAVSRQGRCFDAGGGDEEGR